MLKKVLVINGSPKREGSVTMIITNAFIKGINSKNEYNIETICVSDLNIIPCKGCLSCWGRTEGNCIIKNDDVSMVKEKILNADIIIASFPLYFFGIPGQTKALLDRLLSLMLTYRGQRAVDDRESYHGLRYPKDGQKLILVSSCAYTDIKQAYEPLIKQFNAIFGSNHYTKILSCQTKTLIDIHNKPRLDRYLAKYEQAGVIFNENGVLSKEEEEELMNCPFSHDTYKVLLSNFWKEEKEKENK